jgi:hypothetical protein
MIFHTYDGSGAIYEPAPIYAFQLHWLKRDQRRFRIRRRTLFGLNYLRLWSMFAIITFTSLPYVYA